MRVIISNGFIKAFESAFDLRGTKEWPNIYNSRENDYNALRRDWNNVGEEIRESASKIGREKCGSIR